MCPIVPTFRWGFVRSNFAFPMIYPPPAVPFCSDPVLST
jgi:hypothetical protein